jgi:hypothetical protein
MLFQAKLTLVLSFPSPPAADVSFTAAATEVVADDIDDVPSVAPSPDPTDPPPNGGKLCGSIKIGFIFFASFGCRNKHPAV